MSNNPALNFGAVNQIDTVTLHYSKFPLIRNTIYETAGVVLPKSLIL